jgi:hypothetical protein
MSLPKTVHRFDALLVIVCRLSKGIILVPTHINAKTPDTAKLFYSNFYCEHRLPNTIIFDHDGKFISDFWRELFIILSINLKMSSAQHPQTDGQSERTIQTVKEYLRIFIDYNQEDWDLKCCSAKFAYMNSHHSSTKLTPYQIINGHVLYTPLSFLSSAKINSHDNKVKQFIRTHSATNLQCFNILFNMGFVSSEPDSSLPSSFEKLATSNMC